MAKRVYAFGAGRRAGGAAASLGPHTSRGILPADPFVTPDRDGVGELVAMAAERGRETRPRSPSRDAGPDDVGCSPFRVPIARLAAAQAALDAEGAAAGGSRRTA